MKVSLLYKTASILLVLFAVGHTFGFRQIDPRWGIDPLILSMKSIRFQANGFERTYWDFYVGFGLSVSLLLLLAAVFAWQLSNLPRQTLRLMRSSTWSFALCFAFVAYLGWRYFFIIPLVFSIVICLCLAVAASSAGKPSDDALLARHERE